MPKLAASAPPTKPRMLMGFDFGTKRHGVALGNELTQTVTPLTEIPARDGIPAWQILNALIEEWQPDAFVVGLPLDENLAGTELSQRATKLAKRLFGRYGKPCYGMNERGSTKQAKKLVRLEGGHQGNFSKQPVDSLAAAVILEDWLNLCPDSNSPYLQQLAGPHAKKLTPEK